MQNYYQNKVALVTGGTSGIGKATPPCGRHLVPADGHRRGHFTSTTALQAAKRWVRGQEPWRSPYFWGTFVLVGPN